MVCQDCSPGILLLGTLPLSLHPRDLNMALKVPLAGRLDIGEDRLPAAQLQPLVVMD